MNKVKRVFSGRVLAVLLAMAMVIGTLIPTAEFTSADDLTLVSASVMPEGFAYAEGSADLSMAGITDAGQDFSFTMKSTRITGVTVTPASVTYDGETHPAATVSGTRDGDTVTYKLGENAEQTDVPEIQDPGTYSLLVTVQRAGFDNYTTTVQPVVSKADITLNVTEYNAAFDKAEHPAIEVTGLLDSDTVTYALNNGTPDEDIPQIKNVGDYSVTVRVQRHGYNDFEQTYSNIHITATAIEGLSAASYQGTYDSQEHDAVTVSGTETGDTVEYKLGEEDTWTTTVPKIKDASEYTVYVRVSRENYSATDVVVTPVNASIRKADQSLSFQEYTGTGSTVELTGAVPYENKTYNFAAVDSANLAGGTISYEIEAAEEDPSEVTGTIAKIDPATGILQVYYPGTITVKATLTGNENYNPCTISHTLTVTGKTDAEGEYIYFAKDCVPYVLGANNGVASTQQAVKRDKKIRGNISYAMDTAPGLKIDAKTGKITITDEFALADAVREAKGTLNVKVHASKSKSQSYGADHVSYNLAVSFAKAPQTPYTLTGTEGTNDWYISAVDVTPANNYQIAKKGEKKYQQKVTYEDQGDGERYIYLKNTADGEHKGEVTDYIPVDIKIDTMIPETENMKITYSESVLDKVISGLTFGYYNPSVTVTFEGDDEISGLSHLNWTYTREDKASTENLDTETGEISFTAGKKTAELVLTGTEAKQYRGNLSFTVTDIAGNTSDTKKDTYRVIVVDTIAPNCEISYADPLQTDKKGEKQQRFFDKEVPLTIKVTETNFYEEEFVLKNSKNGGEAAAVMPTWEPDPEKDNVYIGSYTLSGDGDYVVTAEYKDRSANTGKLRDKYNDESESYESDIITIDMIDPDVSFTFDRDKQETVFTVKEHNFRPTDITASVTAKDRNGNSVAVNNLTAELQAAEWTKKEDTYTYTTANYVNGIYNIKLDYKDAADREASYTGAEFIIDHDKPTAPVIEYSKSIVDTVLGAVTLGFYNPSVTVTFTSRDSYSGVDYFTWSYTRQSGASETNAASYADSRLKAAVDPSDPSKFTASITLPLKEAEQLRGSVAATATDTYKNQSVKFTDSGKVLVVDTVSPEMTVEYSEESRKDGTALYYGNDKNGRAEVTLNVTEANFFPEDVVVKVSRNGAAAAAVTPTWTDVNADSHIGRFTISGNGHYVVTAEYTDRSTNKMSKYTSGTITIDTINPVIEVAYQNNDVINMLPDRDGNQRKYHDRAQTAEVTITEHNFNPADVAFHIAGRDVTGAERNIDSLITRSAWSSNGDVHKMTITYTGDANYTFDVDYADMGENKADDYAPDYFTVDTVAPTITGVAYSASVLETVLQNVGFGFYNAKMTVTITAVDDTAGVHRFDYSYLNAAGVSSVNAQLLDQAIEEGNITFSDGGRTATMSFEIPQALLGNSSQFNGTVAFDAIDRSGNKVEQAEAKRLVVDNISPTATVAYNDPTNSANGISYYNGNIDGTITINEANFYSEDVVVMASRDGGAPQVLPTTWRDSSVDVHVGSFTLTEDGDYVITVTYRDKSGNVMAEYTSNQLTLDTKIDEPVFTINGTQQTGDNGGAYKDNAEIAFRFEDQNYDANTIRLTRTRYDRVEDVTEEFIETILNENGGSGSFTIPKTVANDGIYLLTISMTDKANHSTESHVRFTVNRYGSVYAYDEYLCSLIKDGGQYVSLNGDAAITEDLVITEYNADRLVEGSLKILITRDGEPIDVIYTSELADTTGWFEYVYTISKDNFKEDGVYKITISSEDETGNASTSVPDNSIGKDGEKILDVMTFTVDTTAPEIRNIANLENAIADRDAIVDGRLNVRYTMIDVGGLARVEVYLNGEVIDTIEEFETNNSYTGDFDISESSGVQTVRLVATDLAGNVTDTASDTFDPGDLYTFNDRVTVSTNFFVRWYRNTPVFWGSIAGVAALAGGGIFLIAKKRKKKEEALTFR